MKIYILLLGILIISFISAETFGYNYLEEGTNLNPTINYSTLNVNNSQFLNGQIAGQLNVNSADLWDALDSPSDILTSLLNNDVGWVTSQNGLINSSSWLRSGTNVFLHHMGDMVGIGTSSPTHKLNVVGSGNFTGNITANNGVFNNVSYQLNQNPSNSELYAGWCGDNYVIGNLTRLQDNGYC